MTGQDCSAIHLLSAWIEDDSFPDKSDALFLLKDHLIRVNLVLMILKTLSRCAVTILKEAMEKRHFYWKLLQKTIICLPNIFVEIHIN